MKGRKKINYANKTKSWLSSKNAQQIRFWVSKHSTHREVFYNTTESAKRYNTSKSIDITRNDKVSWQK